MKFSKKLFWYLQEKLPTKDQILLGYNLMLIYDTKINHLNNKQEQQIKSYTVFSIIKKFKQKIKKLNPTINNICSCKHIYPTTPNKAVMIQTIPTIKEKIPKNSSINASTCKNNIRNCYNLLLFTHNNCHIRSHKHH